MLSLSTLPRKFQIGVATIEDPAPDASLEEVQRILSQQYPMVRHTRIYEEDGQLNTDATEIIYQFELIPVKTKG